MKTSPKHDGDSITIVPLTRETLHVGIIGRTPLLLNRMSQKAMRQLLLPAKRKNRIEKETTAKHDPYAEFRASPYTLSDPSAPTLLAHLGSAFKGALMTAALDQPGVKKTQIGRLLYVEGHYVPIYGLPQLSIMITRNADINRTPDPRTRVIVPIWGTVIDVTYVRPILTRDAVANLLSAAGITSGVGDGRPEKGKLNFGQFEVVSADNERLEKIMQVGRVLQEAAMANPTSYDRETDELLAWYQVETVRRGFVAV